MTRMKKCVAATAIVAALVGAPTMAHALAPAQAPAKASAAVASAPMVDAKVSRSTSTSTVRVVAPGERVQAAPGVELWLTKEGKHWSTPEMPDQFRSVVDGNLDWSRPGVSLQAEPVDGRHFLSGVYHGTDDAARVTVVTRHGTITGTVVHLPGQPGWGAWYATTELPDPTTPEDEQGENFPRSVTVHDNDGHTIATLNLS